VTERVLITGGGGFIGLHLARHLLDDGAEVTLLDDLSRAGRDAELELIGRRARLVEHDLTTPIPPGLLRGTFDHVYHLAGFVGVGRVAEQPYRALHVNIVSTMRILDWCREQPPGAIFLSSTSEIGDGAAHFGLVPFPVPEDVPFVLPEPAIPRSTYALSKMVAESLLRHLSGELRVRIGRYYNIYGPRMGDEHVIPHFIARSLARRDPFPIYGGKQSRSFCYVDDAVAATVALTRLVSDDLLLVNIGNDQEELQMDGLARRVTRLAGYQPELRYLEPPAGSSPRRRPDLSALRAATGLAPRVDLDAGLAATFDWYASRYAQARR
jgi:UDP-glucuronate decarboxylase